MMQVKVAALTMTFLALFVATALISALLLHDHHKRKIFVGSVGLVTSIALYGAPLVAVVSLHNPSCSLKLSQVLNRHAYQLKHYMIAW